MGGRDRCPDCSRSASAGTLKPISDVWWRVAASLGWFNVRLLPTAAFAMKSEQSEMAEDGSWRKEFVLD